MVMLKCSGSNGVRELILRMNDMASQLKGLDMEMSEGFLVHFIMSSLPAQFDPFKINYNTQKEKWKMSELITECGNVLVNERTLAMINNLVKLLASLSSAIP
ncbi:hypothetical protein RJ639_022683 [Escallonia herrerae]|uniref:UBN2 domain-containing protein n=1 Tax=Escallonia herrerae TaxID=1293975 RepID=A0AA88UZK3_9ASTE|nr:hypothetical protein RJ639_022683 [Escallonia herrerae]